MEIPTTKKCTKCGEVKSISCFSVRKNRDNLQYYPYCRPCNAARNKEYLALHPEKSGEWGRKNKERVAFVAKQYRSNNADKVREKNARWRSLNPEKTIKYSAKWRAANPDKQRAATKNWQTRNAELKRAYSKQWREDNREHLNQIMRDYRSKNPEKIKEINKRARAKQKAMRVFFKMHRAMHAIAETLNQLKNDAQHTNENSDHRPVPFPIQTGIRRVG